jgi:hypothetical protein
MVSCRAPPSPAGEVEVEVSLDNGTNWTDNNLRLRYYTCPGTPPCSAHGTCNPDSACACAPGYFGAACERECPGGAASPCSGHGRAADKCNADGTCTCVDGYWGAACNATCAGFAPPPQPGAPAVECSGRGECLSDGSCDCDDGFTGSDCSLQCQEGSGEQCRCPLGRFGPTCDEICPGGESNPCSGRGTCTNNGECRCDTGYFGPTCASECPGGASNSCSGHAIDPRRPCGANGLCECAPGFWGASCQNQCPTNNSTLPCSGHGTCDATGACNCFEGFAFSDCSLSCPLALQNNSCHGRGACRFTPSTGVMCVCRRGYWGVACENECPGGAAAFCSGRGVCTERGACACVAGYWGPLCSSECPGGAARPCNGRGVCDSVTGVCVCTAGAYGAACENDCPGGLSDPCSGNGTCATNGTCQCNTGHSGSDCLGVYCPYECYHHGECVEGVCKCDPLWLGTYCSVPVGLGNSSSVYGVIQFNTSAITVAENVGTLRIALLRLVGARGDVSAFVSTHGVTALPGEDFVALSAEEVSWAHNDSEAKFVNVDILLDSVSEDTERFSLMIEAVSGGAMLGANTVLTITVEGSGEAHQGVVRVVVRLFFNISSLAPGSPARERFEDALRSDVSSALRISVNRVAVVAVEAASGGAGVLATLDFLPVRESDAETPLAISRRFVALVMNGTSELYQGTVTQALDINYMPRFPQPGDDGGTHYADEGDDGGKHALAVGLGVGLSLLVVMVGIAGVCYRKRVQVSEWLLYKLGNFRFRSLQAERSQLQEDADLARLEHELDEAAGYAPQPPNAAATATASAAATGKDSGKRRPADAESDHAGALRLMASQPDTSDAVGQFAPDDMPADEDLEL